MSYPPKSPVSVMKRTIFKTKNTKPATTNSRRGWMNIAIDKLDEACHLHEQWVFIIVRDGVNHYYTCDASLLRDAFIQSGTKVMNGFKYSFYADRQTGRIYNNASSTDRSCIIELEYCGVDRV